MTTEGILFGIVGTFVGAGVGFFIRHRRAEADRKFMEDKANNIVEKAKEEAKDIKYRARREAKDIAREEQDKVNREHQKFQNKMNEADREMSKRELKLEQQKENLEKEEKRISNMESTIQERMVKAEAEITRQREIKVELSEKLSAVAGMTRDQAKQELKDALIDEVKVDAAKEVREIEEQADRDAEKKAKRILSIAIGRFAGEYVTEQTITTVELPADEIKGRLIGREGRNIRAFEQICGVDLVIDDTPEVVVLSSFNVVRREIARMTIQKLIADGRIHPAKIEEFYEKSKKEMDDHILELGEKAQMEMGLHGMHPEVLKMIGALNWRTSYTQNQYQHVQEVGMLAGTMAAELGLNVKQARRAGLLHDVGKAIDASAEGSHAVIGADFIKRYGEKPDIVHAVRAHHYDVEPESILAHLVIAADALSGARPGVRKAMMESYVSRLTDIEAIVNSFEGVSNSYALSAGREVRVLVENDKVDDDRAVMLSRDIAKKIEEEMSYPGSIKITVIRETKAVSVAK